MDNMTGQAIDQYLIESYVGEGPIGRVYRAVEEQKGQTSALKLIHSSVASQPDFRTRLLASADTLTKLKHRAIVQVYAVGESNGHLYVATAWVQGKPLAQVGHDQRLPLRLAARLVQLVAEALVYAHRQGMVHGGLHPGNILLVSRGGELPWQPLLTDFRQTSLLKGEPAAALLPYLSPEQCDGKRPNGRSDVYALGVILYQLLTGQLPFQPQTAREAVAARSAAPLRSLRPDVPAVLEAVTLKAMARNTAERYRSMEEFLLFLRREVDKLPASNDLSAATPPPPPPATPPHPPPAPMPPPAASPDADYLIITHPRLSAQKVPLHKWLITIGQRADNDLVLSGEGVSPKHARLERTENGWNVIDMGSLHGTYLENSQLLADIAETWKPGQLLRLGDYTLEWRSGIKQEAAQPPQKAATPGSEGRLYLNLSPTQFSIYPGGVASAVLEIESQIGQVTHLTLAVNGVPTSWVVVEIESITLAPQQKVMVPVTIQPPRHSSAATGSHSFQIEARPDRGSLVITPPVHLRIAPFTDFFAEVRPAVLRHKRPAKIVVHNEGNTPTRYELAAADVNQEVTFKLSDHVEVAPGQSETLTLVGQARQRPFFLHSRLIPFELRLSAGDQTQMQPGRLIAPPIFPWPVLLAAALLLVFLFLFLINTQLVPAYLNPCEQPFASRTISEECRIAAAVAQLSLPAATSANQTAGVMAATTPTATTTPTPTSSATQAELTAEEFVIGQSFNGTDIEAIKLGNGPNNILFVGGLYAGYSPASVELANRMVLALLANPELVPAEVTVYIISVWNPDSQSGDDRLNGNNVDLNRNWSCRWQSLDGRAGAGELSEPESQALSVFVNEIQPEAVIFWNTPIQPINYRVVSPGRCTQAQVSISQRLADTYAEAIPNYATTPADPNQTISGDVTDSIADLGIPAVFVLLDSRSQVDVSDHLPAVQAVLQAFGN